jgi:hypothetical protein
MAVADQRITDAAGLARRIDEWLRATGNLKVTVKAGRAAAQVVELKR